MTEPAWICADCGARHGRRQPVVATWHNGTCGVCGREAAVTEPRDYGHLVPGWRDAIVADQIADRWHAMSAAERLADLEFWAINRTLDGRALLTLGAAAADLGTTAERLAAVIDDAGAGVETWLKYEAIPGAPLSDARLIAFHSLS